MHSTGQWSTNQSKKHRFCVRTRKIALEYIAFTGKRVLGNDNQTLKFIWEYVTVNIYQITPYFLCGLCSLYRAAFCIILRNENKRHLDWFSFTFRKGWGCTKIYCWIYFRLRPYKWKITAANSCIYCLDVAEFIDRIFSLRDMKKDESGSITTTYSSTTNYPLRQRSTTAKRRTVWET